MHPFTKHRRESVAALGEEKLIAAIRRWLGAASPRTPFGIGDDCAVLAPSRGRQLITVDPVIYGRHFDDAVPPRGVAEKLLKRNLSDIAAMGGRPLAITDVLWAHQDSPLAAEIWAGLQAACAAYGVPLVGGHTARLPLDRTPLLAASVIGRARRIISSFTARPGDVLLTAVELRGSYRGEGSFNWNASVDAPPARLRGDLAVLPEIAEAGLVTAGKDISNGGIPGTLAMLLATSRCGATLDLDALPRPPGVELERWLLSFPSFGYLLTAAPENAAEIIARFHARDLACAVVGRIETGHALYFHQAGESREFATITPAP